jgi:hypothetical protein
MSEIELLKKRISAAIKCLEKVTTSDDFPKGYYDPDAKEAYHILKGMKDDELKLPLVVNE